MAHSKQLSAEQKAKIGNKIGALLARHGLGVPVGAPVKLAESFEIYLLRHEDAAAATTRHVGLAKVIRRSGLWHHQIVFDDKPIGFAESKEPREERGEWTVLRVFESELATKFSKAVQHIDKDRTEHEAEVKLVFAPAFHLYAFLLEHRAESQVLVIDSPFSGLAPGKEFHKEAEFLERLQGVRSIRGIFGSRIATIRITPQNVSLGEMGSVTFEARDDQGAPVAVFWTIAPIGAGQIAPAGTPATSATYTSSQQIVGTQAVTIIATSGKASASTTVFLTPISVRVIPAAVQLKQNQSQQFLAQVDGDPSNDVSWNISPNIGEIDSNGRYTAGASIVDSASVTVTAISTLGHKTASATVTLLPPPWTPWKRNLLGAYLLVVFSLVFLLVGVWPSSGPDPLLTQARQAAQAKVDADVENIKKAPDGAAGVNALSALQQIKASDDKALEEAKAKEMASVDPLDRAGPKASIIADRPGATLPRDIDLMFLVLIGGALGAFLHSVRSFTAFVGNEEIKASWAWWYYFHPFLGAILALAFYMAVRGGFLAVTAGTALKTSEVSPFALASIAVFVGMFSKNAITKLSDVFETLFQPSTPKVMKNPLGSTSPPTGGIGLKVAAITPASGPAAGGTSITITGSGFNKGASANFGGISATGVTCASPTSISCVTPPHGIGLVAVEVVSADGQKSELLNGYQYV